MSHKKSSVTKPPVTERIGQPGITKYNNGAAILICPFCIPPHPLQANSISACGTVLQVRAVQMIYKAKYNKNLVCIKCQTGGGEMVQFNNAMIHTHDCSPGVATLVDPPDYSRYAEWVSKLPEKIRVFVEKYTGEAKSVAEVTEDGTRTGNILGYFFYKRSNAKHPQTQP